MTEASDSSGTNPRSPVRGKPLLIGLLLAVSLHAVAELAIAVALPRMSSELDGASLYGAAIAAYLLASIISLVWSGHMIDAKGPSFPFISGLIVFSVGNIIAAMANSMEVLVFARVIQGLGGGAFSTVVYAAVNKSWNDDERPRILALLSAAWVLPGLVAPMAAGAIVEYLSWRWIFLLLLPLTLITGLLAARGIFQIKPGSVEASGTQRIIQAFRIAVGATMVLVAISRSIDELSFLLIVAGVTIGWKPIVEILPPGKGLQRQYLLAALAAKFVLVFAFFGADAFLPLALIDIHGFREMMAGVILTIASISWSAAAFGQARLAKSFSPHKMVAWSLLIMIVSISGLLFLLIPGMSPFISYFAWAIGGVGIGFAWNTLAVSAMANTIPGKEGATSTATGLAESLSIGLSSGIGGAILNYGNREGHSLSLSIGAIWVLCIVVMALGLIIILRYVERRSADELKAARLAAEGSTNN